MTKVAVVLLNWNGANFLRKFLPSLIQFTPKVGVRLIVADNGSTDESEDVVDRYFPEVEFLDLAENFGFALGYNEALKQIDAEYYVLLNSDIELSKGWLSPMLQAMEQDSSIGACQPKILDQKQKEKFEYAGAAGGYIDQYGYPFCRGRVMDHCEKDSGQYDSDVDVFWGSGACLMVRSSIWKKAGGFDSEFWAHFEEIDLCWRMQSMGFRVVFCSESVVYHVGGGSLSYDNPRKLFLNFRNNLFLLYKNLPSTHLVIVLFARMVLDGVASLQFLLKGSFDSFVAVFDAHLAFYKSLSSLKRKRDKNKLLWRRDYSDLPVYRGSVVWNFFVKGNRTFSTVWKE